MLLCVFLLGPNPPGGIACNTFAWCVSCGVGMRVAMTATGRAFGDASTPTVGEDDEGWGEVTGVAAPMAGEGTEEARTTEPTTATTAAVLLEERRQLHGPTQSHSSESEVRSPCRMIGFRIPRDPRVDIVFLGC